MNDMERDEIIRKAAIEVLDIVSVVHQMKNNPPERCGDDTYYDEGKTVSEASDIIRKALGKIQKDS